MQIIEKKYRLPDLAGELLVRIFLPNGYEGAKRSYPVLYMNDGQDVFFDEQTYYGAESLRFATYYRDYSKFLPEIIIVAVSAPRDPGTRTALYSPYVKDFTVPAGKKFESHIEGKGISYLQWMAEMLKADIDKTYRTCPDADCTALCGYSTGGLNSVFASLECQNIFHRIIAMSPALAIWKDRLTETMSCCKNLDMLKYVYLDVGTNESGRMTTAPEFLDGSKCIAAFYTDHGLDNGRFKFNVYPGATHTQSEWRTRFPDALRWIFQDL